MEFQFDTTFSKIMTDNNLDTVLLLGHMNPDGDAVGSVMGLSHYITDHYPNLKAYPYLEETAGKGPRKLLAADPTFQPFHKPDLPERYAVIICDTAKEERIVGRELYENASVSLVIDHHAANTGYGTVNYTRIGESCAEILYSILDRELLERKGNDPQAADYIYMGILHDTDCFSRAGAGTLSAASGLIEAGVKHQYIMETLQTDTYEDLRKQCWILDHTVLTGNGRIAYILLDRKSCEEGGIGYDDIHPISGILRDCEDIDLAFTLYEQEGGWWKGSFRSDGQCIDVNKLMAPYDGGGHAGAAGIRKQIEDPKAMIEEILSEAKQILGC